ncbi:MAG: hypothetical protein ACK559_08365, partial [bacterium]
MRGRRRRDDGEGDGAAAARGLSPSRLLLHERRLLLHHRAVFDDACVEVPKAQIFVEGEGALGHGHVAHAEVGLARDREVVRAVGLHPRAVLQVVPVGAEDALARLHHAAAHLHRLAAEGLPIAVDVGDGLAARRRREREAGLRGAGVDHPQRRQLDQLGEAAAHLGGVHLLAQRPLAEEQVVAGLDVDLGGDHPEVPLALEHADVD